MGTNTEIKKIISYLQKKIEFQNIPKEGIKANLVEISGNNILSYINFIDMIIDTKVFHDLINLFDLNIKKKFFQLSSALSQYKQFQFEEQLLHAIENSYFEYSVISISLYDLNNKINYMNDFLECQKNNCLNVKYLFYGEEIIPQSQKGSEMPNYSTKPYDDKGIYFTDNLDYISFYRERENNKGKSISINSTFICNVAEIYYDKRLKETFFNSKSRNNVLEHSKIEEIKNNHPENIAEKKGLNVIILPNNEQLKSKKEVILEKQKGKFIANR